VASLRNWVDCGLFGLSVDEDGEDVDREISEGDEMSLLYFILNFFYFSILWVPDWLVLGWTWLMQADDQIR